MKIKFFITIIFAFVLVFVVQDKVLASSTNPQNRYTGAPGDLGTCANCHDSYPLNSGDGNVSLSGVPSTYVPGSTYSIIVNLSDNGQSRWGFELTVLDNANNDPAGTITVTDSTNTQKLPPASQYIKHTGTGTYAGIPNVSPGWSFQWTAPSPGVGPVTFYVAGNAANNGGTSADDYIYTNTDQSLAVELSAFNATSTDGISILFWRTETEVNNVGFSIYRSNAKDGQYNKIGWIEGAGSSGTPHDYQYIDTDVEIGKTYFYYIEDVDIAGERNKSDFIEITISPKLPITFTERPHPQSVIPTKFVLLQNFPNPFNPETWVPFKLPNDSPITISIYDTKGRLIRTIALGNKPAGVYVTRDKAAYWDGRNNLGDKVPSGVYFYTLQAGKFRATRKMVIVK